MRVLIAFEDSYRSYGQTAAGAIRWLRPGTEVSLVRAGDLGEALGSLDPHMVVCNRPNEAQPGGRAAWARLSDDPEEPSEFCVGGHSRWLTNPDFRELLRTFDEAEELVRDGRDPGGC